MTRETVLITGASSGIGAELARLFAADGSNLVLVARREEQLRALGQDLEQRHGVQVRVLPSDLSRQQAPREVVDRLAAWNVDIDVLVNNAGFGSLGTVAELATQQQLDMIQVNVLALTHLTRLLLPGMIDRRRGAVLNVASTAAFQPGPRLAVYYATKAFVLSFSEALAEELRGSGVAVTCLAPGPTETEFASVAHAERARLFRWGTMSSESVARAGHDGLRRGKVLVVPGLRNRLLAFSVRLAPRALARKVAAFFQS